MGSQYLNPITEFSRQVMISDMTDPSLGRSVPPNGSLRDISVMTFDTTKLINWISDF